MKKKRGGILFALLLGVCIFGATVSINNFNTVVARAEGNNIGDNLDSEDTTNQSNDDGGIADYLKKHKSVTNEQMNKASEVVSPVTSFFGYLTGGVIVITSSAIFVITALDLAYIAIPFLRGLLYSGDTGSSSGAMSMGGYGMRGGYSQAGNSGGGSKPLQLVSDEAIQAVSLASGQSSSMGMQGYGMGMQGSMQQQSVGTKSVILAYFKKRIFFIVLFAICTIVLTSSILLGTGVNLAKWIMQLIQAFNNAIPI